MYVNSQWAGALGIALSATTLLGFVVPGAAGSQQAIIPDFVLVCVLCLSTSVRSLPLSPPHSLQAQPSQHQALDFVCGDSIELASLFSIGRASNGQAPPAARPRPPLLSIRFDSKAPREWTANPHPIHSQAAGPSIRFRATASFTFFARIPHHHSHTAMRWFGGGGGPARAGHRRGAVAKAAAAFMVLTMCQRSTILAVDRCVLPAAVGFDAWGRYLPRVIPPLPHPRNRSKFRKCSDTGFCKQFRDVDPESLPRYKLTSAASNPKTGFFGGVLRPVDASDTSAKALDLNLRFYEDGTFRMRVKESQPLRTRFEPDGAWPACPLSGGAAPSDCVLVGWLASGRRLVPVILP